MRRSVTHQQLADAVSMRHQALDQHPALRVLLSEDVATADYVKALRLLHDSFALIEPVLRHYEQTVPTTGLAPWIPKIPAINADLQALGFNLPYSAVCEPVPTPDSQGTYLGIRYVLEGSAQGGAYIARHIGPRLPGVIKNTAFRYWSLQQQVSADWPFFLSVLSQLDGDAEAREQAVVAARQTFDIFLSAFARVYK